MVWGFFFFKCFVVCFEDLFLVIMIGILCDVDFIEDVVIFVLIFGKIMILGILFFEIIDNEEMKFFLGFELFSVGDIIFGC